MPRLLGYWKSALTDAYALPHHFEAPLDPAVRKMLVAYLGAGQLVNQYRGFSYCRYGCGENGSAERTDGEWVWPEGLTHYVEEHGVALPREFIDHVGLRRKVAPPLIESEDAIVSADEDDWLRWCDERMPATFKTAVRTAVAAAEQRALSALDAAALETERQHGVGDTECMRGGCERRAVRDRAFCARCELWTNGTEETMRGLYESNELQALLGDPKLRPEAPTRLGSRIAGAFRRLWGR